MGNQDKIKDLTDELKQIAKDYGHIPVWVWPSYLMNRVEKIETQLKELKSEG